ncbi:MAG TPA: hypothetical protein VMZ27_07545 [Candidatus Saccharimonadales bacterium]|nr:hypothetical protein [Candidatus Saccharimonadales bacterium]
MRVIFRKLLHNSKTGLYYDGRGGWTEEENGAWTYLDTADALQTALELGCKDVHLVGTFAGTEEDNWRCKLSGITPLP